MEKHLVLAGGGHAHMICLENLAKFVERGHKVTVIGPSPYHYYSGMGPGMLGGTYTPEEIRFATQQVVENAGGTFVHDTVEGVDPKEKRVLLKSGEAVSYDVVSFNIGSFVPKTIITEDNGDIYSVKPIEKLLEAKIRVLKIVNTEKSSLVVVGGGPAAAEVAGNLCQLTQNAVYRPDITVFSGGPFMERFSDRIQKKTSSYLKNRGINIKENTKVASVKTGEVGLATGETVSADIIFMATGVTPSRVFKKSSLPTGPDGGLLVNQHLQSVEYPEIFGGGDCIYFKDHPLDKVGVYAVRQNPVLFHNLMASLEGTAPTPFDPGGNYLLIFNLGDGIGILKKKWIIFGGRLAFIIKDYIDVKFIKRFQAIESI